MNDLKIVKGNSFETIMKVRAYKYSGEEIEDFDLHNCSNINITAHVNETSISNLSYQLLEDNNIQISWPTNKQKLGKYSVEVVGSLGDTKWRFYDKQPIFTIVNTNKEANIPKESIIKEDFYQVNKLSVYIVCPKGDKGDKGDTGLLGPKGDNGDTGATGPKGDKGDVGATGPQGPQGERGPQGETGDTGPLGEQGPLGEPGIDGSDGKSAYELAVENGYEGTVSQWLASLKGADGQDGLDGADGQNGTDGSNGLDGITPHIDPTSKHWVIGSTDTGVVAEGQNGTNGTNGNDGVTPHIDSTTGNWFIGSTNTGVQAQGPQGDPGTNGTNGSNGSNGADGITPTVSVTSISGGHNVAFDYGSGDSRNANFDVMDGSLANQLQADWNQTDNTQVDYIKNKPSVVTSTTSGLKIEVVAAMPASPDANTIYIVQ